MGTENDKPELKGWINEDGNFCFEWHNMTASELITFGAVFHREGMSILELVAEDVVD